jgi:hypothetical protein
MQENEKISAKVEKFLLRPVLMLTKIKWPWIRERPLEILTSLAQLKRPVVFHSL